MVTLVGTQNDFIKAVKELIELEYEALETYEAAINRIEDAKYSEGLNNNKKDHDRHISELSKYLSSKNEPVPNGPSGTQLISIGKVAIGGLIGDKAILKAISHTEDDTNIAYERMNNHSQKDEALGEVLIKGLEDERRHKVWLETILKAEDNDI